MEAACGNSPSGCSAPPESRMVSTGIRSGGWRGKPLRSPDGGVRQGRAKIGDPYQGYYSRILTRQGSHVPGGRYNYVINGNMIAGFALVAFPGRVREPGIMTLLVSHHGKVYPKDLGPRTAEIVKAMQEYNPDATWTEAREYGDLSGRAGHFAQGRLGMLSLWSAGRQWTTMLALSSGWRAAPVWQSGRATPSRIVTGSISGASSSAWAPWASPR